MPHQALKLMPGVDVNKTPALNEAAISQSQLVRFVPDRTLGGLVQKLGGWTRFYAQKIGSTVRCLWAWEDTNSNSYLGVGADGIAPIDVSGASSTTAGGLVVTGASGAAGTATLTYTGGYTFVVGTTITVSGMTPGGYNGTYTVTASGTGTVSYVNATTGFTTGGKIGATATLTFTGPFIFTVGKSISVSGINPNGYNGTFTITGATLTSVSYFVTSTPGAYVSGGVITGGGNSLGVIISSGSQDITPEKITANAAVNFSTTAGSNAVVIVDPGRNTNSYYVVDIQTQVSVGGIVLFGQYQVVNPSLNANQYTIYAGDRATSTVPNGGAVPVYTTANGTAPVNVLLNDHGYLAGDVYPALVATTVGGITIYKNYTVTSVSNANNFSISGSVTATSTATGSENGGQVRFVYHNGVGPSPPGLGYGSSGYGLYGYGGSVPAQYRGVPINAVDWTLDNWGQVFIANPLGGPVYQWDPTVATAVAEIIVAAPSVNQGVFVAMPQRQIVAWGSTFNGLSDPLLIRWCNVNNYDEWTASITNQAGSYRIPKGSRVIQCIQAAQQALIWTDLGIWAMQYVGLPYVYQFNELGTGCGLIGRKAATSMNGVVYWMGQSQFYRLAGNGVEPIKCPIWDVVFQDLDTDNLDRIRVAANSRFGEMTWYFPTRGNGGENYGYVKYSVILDQWDYGFNSTANPYVARSAWINESVLGPPIGAGLNQYLYQHETSTDADGVAMNSYFQTGYFALTEADVKSFIDQVWPDMKWGYFDGTQGANILLTFYVTDYPGQTPTAYGPYTLTQATTFITPRFRGRLVSIRIESNDIGSFWRLGNIRYRIQADGKF